jgi:capsid protein
MDYAGQLRGISPLSICIHDLENILDFTLAQVEKAKNHSNIAFTVESETEEPAADPLANYSPKGAGPRELGYGIAAKQYGSNPDPDPDALNVTEESLEPVYTDIPHTSFSKPGSAGIFSLKGKQKLKPFPDTAPSQSFNVFVDGYFAYIAAATGTSIETALMRFNNNYSASRATLILTWRIAEQRRWEMDYYILGPVYEMWLSEEIASGRVSCPGWLDPRLRAAWTAHRYAGLSMPNIDPKKNMEAAMMAAEVGSTTLENMAQEYNDSDAESNRIKLKQELAELREIGAMPWKNGNKMTEDKDDDDDDNDDDNGDDNDIGDQKKGNNER